MAPIFVNISLDFNFKEDFDGLIPILNPYSTVNNSLKVDLWKDCGPDNKCQTDLQLELHESKPLLLLQH